MDSQLFISTVYFCRVNRTDIQSVCRFVSFTPTRKLKGSWLLYTAAPPLVLLVFILDVLHHCLKTDEGSHCTQSWLLLSLFSHQMEVISLRMVIWRGKLLFADHLSTCIQLPAGASDWSNAVCCQSLQQSVHVRLLNSFSSLFCLGLTWCSTRASQQRCASFAHSQRMRPLAQNGASPWIAGPTHSACSACREGRHWDQLCPDYPERLKQQNRLMSLSAVFWTALKSASVSSPQSSIYL